MTAFGDGTFNFGPTGASCTGEDAILDLQRAARRWRRARKLVAVVQHLHDVERHLSSGGTTVLMGLGLLPTATATKSERRDRRQCAQFRRRRDGHARGRDLRRLRFPAQRQCHYRGRQLHHDQRRDAARHQRLDERFQGGTMLGTGVYTLTGYFAAGATRGGNVTCTSGRRPASPKRRHDRLRRGLPRHVQRLQPNLRGRGILPRRRLYATSLSPLRPAAPYQQLVVVGPLIASGVTAGTCSLPPALQARSLSGAFYTPNGQIYMNWRRRGAASGGCLEIIAQSFRSRKGPAPPPPAPP